MVSDPFIVGVLYGFVPAMGFLYILLHQYQAFFNEKRLFKTFFGGLLVGLAVTVLESFFGPGAGSSLAAVALFALLFGVLETAVGMAVLNWRTFRGRRDTPFYAAALGLAVGAINAVFIVGRSVPVLTQGATGWAEVYILTLLGLYFMGSILVRAGAYTWIGQGTAQGELIGPGLRSALVIGAYTFAFLVLARLPDVVANAVPVVAIAAAIGFIAHVLRTVLDRVVPDEVLREAGIHRRRMARRRMRSAGSTEEPEEAGTRLEHETVPDQPRE